MDKLMNAVETSLPAILALVRASHANSHPDAPPPTDAEVIAALHSAVAAVVAKGAAWKAQHPGK
jgi:hypothetical protein